MNDREKMTSQTEAEIVNYLHQRKINDKWLEVSINDCKLATFDKLEKIGKRTKLDFSLTNQNAINTTIEDTGLFLISKIKKINYVIPVRFTAVTSIYGRAGFSCQVAYNETTNGGIQALSKERKTELITEFFKLFNQKAKILIRDGKASFMASSSYSILNEFDLLKTIDDTLEEKYPMKEFIEGEVSHSNLRMSYKLNDDDMEQSMKILSGVNNVESGFTFVTSDIGESSASAFPYFILNESLKIFTGAPVSVKHIGSNSVKDFKRALKKMNASFESSIESFDKLSKISINHVPTCILNISTYLKLPKRNTEEIVSQMLEYEDTALAVYFKLCEIITLYASQDKSVERSLYYQELVARNVDINFKMFDVPDKTTNVA